MIVLVETNFVLELAFGRDKFASCRELIEMAARKEIDLFLPAYSFVEPNETIIRRQKARRRAHQTLSREIKEITRSIQFEQSANQLAELTGLLIQVGEVEQAELRSVTAELLQKASVINLDSAILARSFVLQGEFGLSPQDAVVFASVLSALEQRDGPACFLTKNAKDFATPDIADALEPHDCKVLYDFEQGLNYIKNKLDPGKPGDS